MIDRLLLPSQTDQFYAILSEDYGINPREFDVIHTKVQFQITHIRTGFYFKTSCSTDNDYSFSKFETEFWPTNINTNCTGISFY